MANIKLLQEAIQAFASGETKTADAKMRKFFVEQAQEINKKFEESIEGGEQESLFDEIEYPLGQEDEVEFDDGKGAEGWVAYDDPINEADDEEEKEVDVDVDVEGSDEFGQEDQGGLEGAFVAIKGAFDELEALFAEVEGELDLGTGEEEEESFDDVSFGTDDFKESVAAGRLKKVTAPSETAAQSKSPVAGRPEAFVKGVEEVKIKDGSVDLSTTENVKTDVDVTDNDNVMDNAKGLMKNVKVPKETAAQSKSPVAKRK